MVTVLVFWLNKVQGGLLIILCMKVQLNISEKPENYQKKNITRKLPKIGETFSEFFQISR